MTNDITMPTNKLSTPARIYLISAFMQGVYFAALLLYLNLYLRAMGFDQEFMGIIITTPFAAALILGIPLGMLLDRIGHKRGMIGGLIVAALGLAGFLNATDPNLMMVFIFIMGVGDAAYVIGVAPLMTRISSKETRSQLFSLNFGFAVFSGVVTNYMAGIIPGWLEINFGIPTGTAEAYRVVLMIAAAVIGAAVIPLMLVKVPQKKQETTKRESPKKILSTLLKNNKIRKLMTPSLVIGIGAALLVPYFNIFFVDKFTTSDSQLGMLFSISSLITGTSVLLGPILAKKLNGRIKAIVLTQSASLVFLLLAGFMPWYYAAAFGFLARNALMNMSAPLWESFFIEQVPENQQGTLNAIMKVSWEFGWTIGPYLSGLIQKYYGFAPLFIITATLYGAATLFVWLNFRKADLPVQALSAPAV